MASNHRAKTTGWKAGEVPPKPAPNRSKAVEPKIPKPKITKLTA